MSDFADNSITDLGEQLIAKVLVGDTITFTKIVLGDGNMPSSQTPATMTDVVSPKEQAAISKCELTDAGQAVVGGRYTNEETDQGFYWRELGLYAQDPDLGEILYSYGYTPDGEYIPASGATLIEKLVDVVTYVGDKAEVAAVFDPTFTVSIGEITADDVSAAWTGWEDADGQQ